MLGSSLEKPGMKGDREGSCVFLAAGMSYPHTPAGMLVFFSALWSELHVQGSHEYPQHALHWPLHCGDGPEINCLQAQGRCSRSRFPGLCVCVHVCGAAVRRRRRWNFLIYYPTKNWAGQLLSGLESHLHLLTFFCWRVDTLRGKKKKFKRATLLIERVPGFHEVITVTLC